MIERQSDKQSGVEYQQEKYCVKPVGLKRLTIKQEVLIREKVTTLPRAERIAIYLHFWENATISKIAVALDIDRSLVKKLIERALTRLSIELQSIVPGCDQLIEMEVAA